MGEIAKLHDFIDELRYGGVEKVDEILIAPTVFCNLLNEAREVLNFTATAIDEKPTYKFFGVIVRCGIDENVIYQA